MAFTDLILRNPNGKPIPPSKYDENFVLATISKNNLIINSSCVQLIDKLNSHSYLIGQNSENSFAATLPNKVIAPYLKLVSSRLKSGDFDHFLSELRFSRCPPLTQNLIFYIFTLTKELSKIPMETKIVRDVNSGIVIAPS